MLLLALALCYLFGSVPFGVIVGKMMGVDVRSVGSGNIGTTNVWRALGPGPGAAVFMLDVLKGVFGPWVGGVLLGLGDNRGIALCALAAALGHTCSVFLKFKGGKAIATGLGVALGLSWMPALIAFGLWGVVVLATRMISAGSVAACVAAPVAYWLTGAPPAYVAVVALIALVAFIKHLPNLKRIAAGTEPKLKLPWSGTARRAGAAPMEPEARASGPETRPETATGP